MGEDNIKESLMRILGENAYSMGNMQVSEHVTKLSKAIYYLTGQLNMVGNYANEDDKQDCREYIGKVLKNTVEILDK